MGVLLLVSIMIWSSVNFSPCVFKTASLHCLLQAWKESTCKMPTVPEVWAKNHTQILLSVLAAQKETVWNMYQTVLCRWHLLPHKLKPKITHKFDFLYWQLKCILAKENSVKFVSKQIYVDTWHYFDTNYSFSDVLLRTSY